MAELAKELIKSTVRGFYNIEQILIIDAVLQHSVLNEDNLRKLLGLKTPEIRKHCLRLREDGILSAKTQKLFKNGSNRPIDRDLYYVDTHRAIDSIKFRIRAITDEVSRRYGQTVEEKKEFVCPQCESSYTQMDVLDSLDYASPTGFSCKRCGAGLENVEDTFGSSGHVKHSGHEIQNKLNQQLAPLTDLLQRIDAEAIPSNEFEEACEKIVPISADNPEDPLGGGAMPSDITTAKAKTVKGQKLDHVVEAVVMDEDDDPQAKARREREAAEEKKKQEENNQLPDWFTRGAAVASDSAKEGPATNDGPLNGDDEEKKPLVAGDEDESKPGLSNGDAVASYYAGMMGGDDSDSDEEDSDDEDEEEGASPAATGTSASGANSPRKKVRIEEPTKSNGNKDTSEDDDSD